MLDQLVGSVGDAIGSIVLFLPALLAFIAVLVIGYIVAKALQKLTNAVLERVGFDKLVERGGVKKAMSRSKYDASDLMARGVYWVTMLFVLQLAFGVFGPNPVSLLLTDLIAYLPNLFVAALIVVVGAAIAAAVREVISAATGGLSYGNLLAGVAAGAILVVTAFAALTQLAIAPAIVTGLFYAILATVAGIAIVAIGGGGIMPMREYWQRGLSRVEREAPMMRQEMQQAPDRVKQRAEERKREIPVSRERTPERMPVGSKQGGGDTTTRT